MAQDRGWVEGAENLLLFGPSGVGKTHIAAAIGHSLAAQGLRVRFTTATILVQALQSPEASCNSPTPWPSSINTGC
jgi:DNA replication protein DnaC